MTAEQTFSQQFNFPDKLKTASHLQGISDLNGEIIAYDTNGRLLSRTHLLGGTPLGGHTYTLDALGRRTAETGGTGVSPVNSNSTSRTN